MQGQALEKRIYWCRNISKFYGLGAPLGVKPFKDSQGFNSFSNSHQGTSKGHQPAFIASSVMSPIDVVCLRKGAWGDAPRMFFGAFTLA